MTPKRLLALVLGGTFLVTITAAQDPLAGLRQKSALTDEDRGTLRDLGARTGWRSALRSARRAAAHRR